MSRCGNASDPNYSSGEKDVSNAAIMVWNRSSPSNILKICLVLSDRNAILASSLCRARVVGVSTRWQRRSSLTITFWCHAKSGYSSGPPVGFARDNAKHRAPGFFVFFVFFFASNSVLYPSQWQCIDWFRLCQWSYPDISALSYPNQVEVESASFCSRKRSSLLFFQQAQRTVL